MFSHIVLSPKNSISKPKYIKCKMTINREKMEQQRFCIGLLISHLKKILKGNFLFDLNVMLQVSDYFFSAEYRVLLQWI